MGPPLFRLIQAALSRANPKVLALHFRVIDSSDCGALILIELDCGSTALV